MKTLGGATAFDDMWRRFLALERFFRFCEAHRLPNAPIFFNDPAPRFIAVAPPPMVDLRP
jgi:hypothetical protein